MRAIYYTGETLLEKRLPKPRRRPGEAVIKVHLAGICSTDLEIANGYMDFRGVPGHEFVGTVVSSASGRLVGKRVVGEINIPCGTCPTCRIGLGKHCPGRSVLGIQGRNGSFAEFLSLPERNLHAVPAAVSDEEAAFAELLAAACEVPLRVKIHRSCAVAVLGDGRLAAMVAQVVVKRTKNVTVLGRVRGKLSVIERLGIAAMDVNGARKPERVFDIVVDCTGNPRGLALAASLVRPRGTIVLKSTYHGTMSWNPAPIVVDEIAVFGSRCGPFDTALSMLEKKAVQVLPFLTAVYPFAEWRTALRRARRADAFKVLLQM